MPIVLSRSAYETKKIASLLARELKPRGNKRAPMIALEGDLGSGKTTFVQGFAKAIGIKENVLSPTFVLMKVYPLRKGTKHQAPSTKFRYLVHIDCYRLDSPQDLLRLGFRDIIRDKDAIVLIEWADRVRGLVPRNAIWLRFAHGKQPLERVIKFSIFNDQFSK